MWIAALAPHMVKFKSSFPYFNEVIAPSNLPPMLSFFAGFDGVHYIRIAKSGYVNNFTQVFFPFYPALIKILSPFFASDLLLTALIISNIAFLVSILVFYKLVEKIKGAQTALWSCLFLIFFPTSFFFSAVYTESIFLAQILLSFYFYQRRQFLVGALFGAFATATRLVGLFLIPSQIRKKNFYILLIPLGIIAYIIYLKITQNRPFSFIESQTAFGQNRSVDHIVLLPQVIYRWLKIIYTNKGYPFFTALLELGSTIFALSMLVAAIKRLPAGWLIFSAGAVLTPTLTGSLTSMPRYILVAFPIYIVLAEIKNRNVKLIILAVFFILLCILTALYFQGYWVA